MARKFISGAEEPLGTFSYQTSSRTLEIRPADWPEKCFSGQSTRRSSRVILSPFYTKWFSSSIKREDSRLEFQIKKDLTKPRRSQIVTWELAILFHQFSRWIYRRYIVKLTSVVFFLKIEINLYSKSTRFLYCYFWLRGKLIENTSLSLLIISPPSLHNF